jgi:acyl-CoA synthetase (AMP-forming)/AMP-acid ligase II
VSFLLTGSHFRFQTSNPVPLPNYDHVSNLIQGGENISPEEIEDCLLEHPDIRECCVVGLADRKYGEVVGCFLRKTHDNTPSLPDAAVRAWVGKRLGRIKEPKHIFWLGEQGVGSDLPKTGSGKYQKHLIRSKGNELLKKSTLARVWKL